MSDDCLHFHNQYKKYSHDFFVKAQEGFDQALSELDFSLISEYLDVLDSMKLLENTMMEKDFTSRRFRWKDLPSFHEELTPHEFPHEVFLAFKSPQEIPNKANRFFAPAFAGINEYNFNGDLVNAEKNIKHKNFFAKIHLKDEYVALRGTNNEIGIVKKGEDGKLQLQTPDILKNVDGSDFLRIGKNDDLFTIDKEVFTRFYKDDNTNEYAYKQDIDLGDALWDAGIPNTIVQLKNGTILPDGSVMLNVCVDDGSQNVIMHLEYDDNNQLYLKGKESIFRFNVRAVNGNKQWSEIIPLSSKKVLTLSNGTTYGIFIWEQINGTWQQTAVLPTSYEIHPSNINVVNENQVIFKGVNGLYALDLDKGKDVLSLSHDIVSLIPVPNDDIEKHHLYEEINGNEKGHNIYCFKVLDNGNILVTYQINYIAPVNGFREGYLSIIYAR